MGIPGPWELLIILIIVIVIFGTGRIAGIGAALGGSIREFKKAVREEDPQVSPVMIPEDTERQISGSVK